MLFYLARLVVAISVLPIVVFSVVLGGLFNVRKFYIKETDNYTKTEIKKRIMRLCHKLDITEITDENIMGCKLNYHRFVTFYEYEKSKKHCVKMDNYVALYDFMRSVTMVLVVYTWYVAYHLFFWDIDIHTSLYVLGSAFLTYFFFMAYMKFYRRYTEESFFTLITDEDLKESVSSE